MIRRDKMITVNGKKINGDAAVFCSAMKLSIQEGIQVYDGSKSIKVSNVHHNGDLLS